MREEKIIRLPVICKIIARQVPDNLHSEPSHSLEPPAGILVVYVQVRLLFVYVKHMKQPNHLLNINKVFQTHA